jgi:hypothetical protein
MQEVDISQPVHGLAPSLQKMCDVGVGDAAVEPFRHY